MSSFLIHCLVLIGNKNAFQREVYRPLIDRIPACTVAGRGVPAQGGSFTGTPPPVDRQTRVKT